MTAQRTREEFDAVAAVIHAEKSKRRHAQFLLRIIGVAYLAGYVYRASGRNALSTFLFTGAVYLLINGGEWR